MTCIAGIEVNGAIYMGGDSAAVGGWDITPSRLRKVFIKGDFVIGYTTSFRMGQLLQYHLVVRKQKDGEDDLRYMVVAFVEAVRECLKEGGFTKVSDEREAGGKFLVGYKGKLYCIESDFQVNSDRRGLMAVGVGSDYALGNLWAVRGLLPVERVKAALECAGNFSIGVCSPYYIECLESKE